MAVTRLPALWFGLLGGVSAYAAHLVASFWAVPFACARGGPGLLHLLAAAMALVAATATAVAVAAWRRLGAGSGSSRLPDRRVTGWSVPYLGALVLRMTAAATGLVAALAVTSGVRGRGSQSDGRPRDAADPPGRAPFMAAAGALLSGLSLLTILLAGLANFLVDPCLR